jgi:WD repeat-containing protein mio
LGEYERSAALAVFHGSLGSAVDALQRGADAIHWHLANKAGQDLPVAAPQYAESLQLVAMCVAGFGGIDSKSPASAVWRRACENLLRRPDLNGDNLRMSRTAYLRSLCTFLYNISTGRSYEGVLEDHYLSLADRVAFACRFLARDQLKNYLLKCVHSCQTSGNIEGLVITGIEKEGIKIIQSYVDETADVQTAALVTSRVILPSDWTSERRVCAEFLDSYRSLLNTWQMWQSRAMFDVDRADLLRRVKIRQMDVQQGGQNLKAVNYQSRRSVHSRSSRQGARQPDPDIVPAVPAQLDARCTYCSASLGLIRLDNHANQWLSKMKPVLSCCPSCQKPLPRCAICLLSLGALNPYMELTRERERTRPNSRGGVSLPVPDDLSSLGNLPFAEWFTWCMSCKHGGHAHHLVGWFANHDVCPVSGCDCRCQFDGIQKLTRPALIAPPNAKPMAQGVPVVTK